MWEESIDLRNEKKYTNVTSYPNKQILFIDVNE